MINEMMKQKALPDILAGWYTSVCPVCGETIYTQRRNDRKYSRYNPCKPAFMPTDISKRMQSHSEATDADFMCDNIRTEPRADGYDAMSKDIMVSICPKCSSYSWTFTKELVSCAQGKPDPIAGIAVM